MSIIHISISPSYRLRLLDGSYVFMAWHRFSGPFFYHDKLEQREVDEWWENPLLVRAVEWFQNRGCKA